MRTLLTLAATMALFLVGCGGGEGDGPSDKPDGPRAAGEDPGAKPATPDATPHAGKPGRALLVTQSEFKPNDKGAYTVPDKGVMLVLQPAGARWKAERVEDAESNVFHKALQYGDEGILTIGANEAKLKLWTRQAGKWQAETLWHPTFGGKHNRLRDFEIADFDGDGRDDLALATHDQGVVAVVWRRADGWHAEELDRQADTFVHEIEVGDLDGDGKLEFFATPSQPNTESGEGQGGKVVRYAWTGEKFEKSEVVALTDRHIKEILVADVEGDGKQELYAALEAQMGAGGKIEKPVEIQRFDWVGGRFAASTVTTIDDRFCRFLVAGDVDGDGQRELVAAAFSAGVWVIEHAEGGWSKQCIDKDSGGFEHATYLADIDGDGKLELYVADDRGGAVRQYRFANGDYDRQVINKRLVPGQAMVWNITVADL